MNAIQAYETSLWNTIPYEIRKSINDSATHGGFNTSYYILIGTSMWDDSKTIKDTLTKLGYKTEFSSITGDGKGRIIEYKLEIYWDKPRK